MDDVDVVAAVDDVTQNTRVQPVLAELVSLCGEPRRPTRAGSTGRSPYRAYIMDVCNDFWANLVKVIRKAIWRCMGYAEKKRAD